MSIAYTFEYSRMIMENSKLQQQVAKLQSELLSKENEIFLLRSELNDLKPKPKTEIEKLWEAIEDIRNQLWK